MNTKRITAGVLIAAAILVPVGYVLRTTAPSFDELWGRGNLLWYNTPPAVRSGANIYAGWMTSRREVVVGQISEREAFAAVVAQYHYLDDHGPPALYLPARGPDAGRVRVFYSLHNSPMFSRITATSGDITSWLDPVVVCDGESTYPVLCTTNDRLLLFYRRTDSDGARPYCFRMSQDHGRSFSDETVLVDAAPGEGISGDWIYSLSVGDETTADVDLLFGVAVEGRVRDVYHIRSSDSGVTWQDGTGSRLTLPVLFHGLTAVMRTEGDRETRVWDVQRDPAGQLAAIWIDYDSADSVVCWSHRDSTTNTWTTQEIARQGLVCYPAGACIVSVSPPVVLVSLKNAEGRYEIAEFSFIDQQWQKAAEPRLSSRTAHDLVRPMAVRNTGGKEVICVGVRAYPGYQRFDTFLRASFLPEHLSP